MNTAEELADLIGGAPTATFPTIGTVVKGRVLSFEKGVQRDIKTGKPRYWDDGNPMTQYIFTLATDNIDPDIPGDDGTRRLFAKAQMYRAIKDAIRESGHRANIVGGTLAVKYAEDGKPPERGFNPPKIYEARFTPPEVVEPLWQSTPTAPAHAAHDEDDFGGGDYDDGEEPF